MTIQIHDRTHIGKHVGRTIHSETFCTNEYNVLKKTIRGLIILEVIIERFRTTILKEGRKERTITTPIPMPLHDYQNRANGQEMSRTLFVIMDEFGKTLFGALDKKYIEKKAEYLDRYPEEIKHIKKIF
jgi:hypothetical protein